MAKLGERLWTRHDWVLTAILLLEIVIFTICGDNFFTAQNAFEIMRIAAALGIVSIAMCFVIKTGGIDLSVASLMALSAVTFAWCLESLGLPYVLSIPLVLLLSTLAGGLNGILVTRLQLPPLIVTLGSMSLFKGIADASTGGVHAFSDFSSAFLALGQGYAFGIIPMQLPIFIAVAVIAWLYMHRSVGGRQITALGFNPEAARFAGIRNKRLLMGIYMFSGFCAGLAMLLFVAKLGQAKSDVGEGYELLSIAVVVLGGTAITGGRGSIHGSILALFIICLLQNGLSLSGLSTDIAQLAVGAVLIISIISERLWSARVDKKAQSIPHQRTQTKQLQDDSQQEEEFEMNNQQVGIIAAAIIVGALLIVLSNVMLVSGVKSAIQEAALPQPTQQTHVPSDEPKEQRISLALMPKTTNDPYFVSCHAGALAAAKEFAVDILWDGPTKANPAKQNELIDNWITKGVDVIAASAENRDAISAYLKKARAEGIKVLTWDADAQADARDYFINQATSEGIGYTLADEAARLCNKAGTYIILSATTTAANQNEWIKYIKERMQQSYPQMKLAEIRYSDGERDKAVTETRNAINKHKDLKAVIAIAAPAVPGAAEAIKQANREDIHLTGLSIPSLTRSYVHEGWIDTVILWNTVDLGYLTVAAARQLANGAIKGDGQMDFGRLKGIRIEEGNIYLGEPFIFTKGNIDNFDF